MAAALQPNQLELRMIRVEELLLDYENPRLSSADEVVTQEQLLKQLYLEYDLYPILFSLAENGYFSEEPLIAVETKVDQQTKFTVVEGNRRLAALKIILFDDDRRVAGAKDIPTLSPDVLNKLNPVPVKVYDTRAEIVAYLGVRHIVGVKPWDALSKAKYIDQLTKQGHAIDQIREIIGMRRGDVIQRWLLTLYVLNQANRISEQPWQETSEDFSFSFLYTSLGYQHVRKYLAIDAELFKEPKTNPVPDSKHKNLIMHMTDLYGAPDRPELSKISDSRQIKKLAAIYETPEALDLLRAGAPLEEAYSRSVGEAAELIELVSRASYQLDRANSIAPHHKKSPEARNYAKRCVDSAQHLYSTLED